MMRSVLIGNLIVATAMVPAAAFANPKALTKKGADPNQVICKVERFVGSNLKNRVCKTRAEWKQVAEDTKQGMDSREYRAIGCAPGSSQFNPTVGQMAGGLPSIQVGCPGGSGS